MKVVFPWPSPKVFPNYKRANHWRKFRHVEKAEREAGCIITNAAIPAYERRELREGLTDKLRLAVVFFPPDRRHRDDDGMVGAFKHFRDGMADSLGIDDKHFRCAYGFAGPEKPGRIEVNILSRKNLKIGMATDFPSAVIGLPPSEKGEAA